MGGGFVAARAADSVIIAADPWIEQKLGYVDESLKGKRLDAVLSPFPVSQPAHVNCTGKGGKNIPCEVTWGDFPDGGSTVRLILLRPQEKKKSDAAGDPLAELARLKQIDQMKTHFINNAAHELKTPLTPVKVQTHLLNTALSEGLTQNQQRSIGILSRNVDRVARLVDDVLEAARIQSNRLSINVEPLDLNPLVLETIESFQTVAREVGVSLEWRACESPIVEGDWERLTQVIYNLVSNAVKFTPAGGKVFVETSKSVTEAFVRIRDNGRGIDHGQLSKLFLPFSQVHDPMQETRAGTGLGLFISQGIIHEHGGRIWAESPGLGRGSTFSFALPLTDKPVSRQPKTTPQVIQIVPNKQRTMEQPAVQRLRELI